MTETLQHPETSHAVALAVELRVLIGLLRRRLRELTDAGEMSWTQISVLGRIENAEKATVTGLARAEGIRPQSMGAVIAALEAVGYVQGTPDPEDGRQTILSLTKRGQGWVETNRAARLDWLSRAIETRLSAAQQERLGEALELLRLLAEP
ncbi:MAG TPA: MarR family transcriptional regulator [Acidocella sp.]|jgi:DNA-binding MarR family transcriptional regulator|nr:MarR family transcriptional regulator [Acidocella sp.]